ncbi:MAG: hypothetical protein ABW065_03905 [Solirubrobacterales bacterium]
MNERPPHGEPLDEELIEEEEDAAAAEAAQIGGDAPRDEEDPARQPLAEAGEGESEGFELAEKDFEDIASHGDQHRFPGSVAPPPEQATDAEYGEADQEIHEDE